ncbi:hypothetical protein CEXT_257661 [Caerostris extrusa]|uniref:Tc1-like transposase DDE domain-containing protein n=1 Tax=Caerostris extrusa TaxID=172846 RepID=A0AAV4MUQ1_CAEEX|nr:hypothetical protein CEXT_257661 [Caerostris extrusa]
MFDANAGPHRAVVVEEYLEGLGLERMESPARSGCCFKSSSKSIHRAYQRVSNLKRIGEKLSEGNLQDLSSNENLRGRIFAWRFISDKSLSNITSDTFNIKINTK